MDHVLLVCSIMANQDEDRRRDPDVELDEELEQGEDTPPTEEELRTSAKDLPVEESGGESEYSLTQAHQSSPEDDDDVENLGDGGRRRSPPRESIELSPDGVELARHALEEATDGRMER
jgi:hypothetical protein